MAAGRLELGGKADVPSSAEEKEEEESSFFLPKILDRNESWRAWGEN